MHYVPIRDVMVLHLISRSKWPKLPRHLWVQYYWNMLQTQTLPKIQVSVFLKVWENHWSTDNVATFSRLKIGCACIWETTAKFCFATLHLRAFSNYSKQPKFINIWSGNTITSLVLLTKIVWVRVCFRCWLMFGGLGGVRGQGHTVKTQKWIGASLRSLSAYNPSQPGLSDGEWQMTSSSLLLTFNPFRINSPWAEPGGEMPPLGQSVGERWVQMSFKVKKKKSRFLTHYCSWNGEDISSHTTVGSFWQKTGLSLRHQNETAPRHQSQILGRWTFLMSPTNMHDVKIYCLFFFLI